MCSSLHQIAGVGNTRIKHVKKEDKSMAILELGHLLIISSQVITHSLVWENSASLLKDIIASDCFGIAY